MSSLGIGTGYVASAVSAELRGQGVHVTQTSRSARPGTEHVSNGAELDHLLASTEWDQVVVYGQLTSPIDWVLERIDGPRWLVFSSHQLGSAFPAPNTRPALAREELAASRGACVLRPTMIYGRGGDRNLSRSARMIRRWRFGIVPGPGTQAIQPVHVDDIASLVNAHLGAPRPGVFPVAGPEPTPIREVVKLLTEIVGARTPPIVLPAVTRWRRLAGLAGLRQDQLERLSESKTTEISATTAAFGWQPAALGIRLEQAVREL